MKKLIIVLVVIVLVGLVIGGLYWSGKNNDEKISEPTAVQGLGILNNNESACDKISVAYQKDMCYATIAVETRNAKVCEKITGPMERNACLSALSQSY